MTYFEIFYVEVALHWATVAEPENKQKFGDQLEAVRLTFPKI